MSISAEQVKVLARQCGFELVGVTPAIPSEDFERYQQWREAGFAGEMGYLTDHRGDLRSNPRNLLPEAQNILCVGKLYNTPHSHVTDSDKAVISRYAWGEDYHEVMRRDLQTLVAKIADAHGEPFQSKVCVDTAPLLERSYAKAAGLGWIGKNTCLINQEQGSWFFLGEVLLSIPLAPDLPAPDRCGTCTRCIQACPTAAIVPGEHGWQVDARLCISYLTIEKRGEVASDLQGKIGNHVFGCDICQDVCPWNRRAALTDDPDFQQRELPDSLAELAQFTAEDFRRVFRQSPVWRTKYSGFLRNVAMALGNTADRDMWELLERLTFHADPAVAATARQSLQRLQKVLGEEGSREAIAACHVTDQSRGSFLAALFIVTGSRVWAAEELQDPVANPGFNHFFNNEYDAALAYFEDQVRVNPNDPAQYNHVAQTILYRELFRDGALESQLVTGNNAFLQRSKMLMTAGSRERFQSCVRKAIELSEARIKTSPRDATAVYQLGVAHGLQANYLFLIEKSWLDSLREASAARRAQERVLEIDPQFIDARLVLGVYQYVVGCLPFYLRAAGFVGGFHGDKEGGIQQLQLVAAKGILNRYDAKILLAVLYRREHKPRMAVPLLQELAHQFDRNYLFRFEQVQMYSDLGDKKSALEVLAEIEDQRRNGVPGYRDLPAEKVQYVRGNLHFWYGDLDKALANLKGATGHANDLDTSTAVMAWLRLGQVYDLQGDHQDAVTAYRASMRVAPGSDAAEEAKGYISSHYKRKMKEDGRG